MHFNLNEKTKLRSLMFNFIPTYWDIPLGNDLETINFKITKFVLVYFDKPSDRTYITYIISFEMAIYAVAYTTEFV